MEFDKLTEEDKDKIAKLLCMHSEQGSRNTNVMQVCFSCDRNGGPMTQPDGEVTLDNGAIFFVKNEH